MQAVQALPASFGSSLRPVSTSNGAGSRAAGSRGPWSSAELATRPVRKGPPKPKGNAPDSRKTRTSNHRIPGEGKGLMRFDSMSSHVSSVKSLCPTVDYVLKPLKTAL